MTHQFVAKRQPWKVGCPWVVERGGRVMASGMGEKTAKRVARLLNADEATRDRTPATLAHAGRPALTAERLQEMLNR